MKLRVMIVDDDEDEILIFKEALKKLDTLSFECSFVTKAMDAQQLLIDFEPDYLFVDINMPTIDGIELLQKLRLRNIAPKARKYLFSTNVSPRNCALAKIAGAIDCFEKGNSIAELMLQLREIFKNELSQA